MATDGQRPSPALRSRTPHPQPAPSLDRRVTARVIEHMNDDHADAVLLYVQVFGGIGEATEARMVSIDLCAMGLEYQSPHDPGVVQLTFEPPLTCAEDLRPRLVAMVNDARDRLREGTG